MSPRAGSSYDQGRHIRISNEVGELVDRLAAENLWTIKVVVEQAVKELAKQQGVKWDGK